MAERTSTRFFSVHCGGLDATTRLVRFFSVFAGIVASVGCGGLPATQGCNNASCALAGTAVAVAAVGVHRAATGACWGMCGAGLVCDHASGLCVAGECHPSCSANESCERISTGLACVPGTSAGFTMTTLPPTNAAPATNPVATSGVAVPGSTLPPLPAVNSMPSTSANPSLPPLVQQ